MRHIKAQSGQSGWRGRLQEVYTNYGEWCNYSDMFGLALRLGYIGDAANSKAWQDNPMIEGSILPSDYRLATVK